MEYLDILNKLKLIYSLVMNNLLFVVLLGLTLLLVILNFVKVINRKQKNLVIMLLFILSFAIILFFNNTVLFKTFDDISNIIFKNVYFPSIYVYIGIVVITNFVFIYSIFSKDIKNINRKINIVFGFLIDYLMLMILNVIGNFNIDINSKNMIYTNNYMVSLIEMTTFLFLLWYVIRIIIFVTDCILVRIEEHNTSVMVRSDILSSIMENEREENETSDNDSSSLDLVPTIYADDINDQDNYDSIDSSSVILNTISFNDLVKTNNSSLDVLKNTDNTLDKLRGLKPILSSNEKITDSIKTLNDKYTKDDYILFNNILNMVKENCHNNIVTMDDALSLNILTKYSLKEYNLYKKMLNDIKLN